MLKKEQLEQQLVQDESSLKDEMNIVTNPIHRVMLIIAGSISLALGIIGIVVPLLPTTPFLLLAASCYSRSSERFYFWLMTNKWFGTYIRNYKLGRGIPLSVKVRTLILLWVTICISAFIFVESIVIRLLLLVIAVVVTIHIGRIKTMNTSSMRE